VDTIRIPPAGDPFTSAHRHLDDHEEPPHSCIDGVVYIGHMVVDEHGDEVEVVEATPCRRCSDNQ
jgi:hypothetical protein